MQRPQEINMRKPVFMTSQCKAAVLDRIVLIPAWFERSLKTDDVTSGKRDTDPQGWFRGESVNILTMCRVEVSFESTGID